MIICILACFHQPFIAAGSFLLLLRSSNNNTMDAASTQSVSIKGRWSVWYYQTYLRYFWWYMVLISAKKDHLRCQNCSLVHKRFFLAGLAWKDRDPDTLCERADKICVSIDTAIMNTQNKSLDLVEKIVNSSWSCRAPWSCCAPVNWGGTNTSIFGLTKYHPFRAP